MALQPGDLAPNFALSDADDRVVRLSDLRGQRVVLYFYPRDNTPGCIKEACGFRDRHAEFAAANAVVLGVSMDDAKSHTKFITKQQLPFALLCDTDAAVATAYESYGLKKFMGKEFMGIFRNTFVIGPDGRIEQIYRKVKPEPHAQEVLAKLTVPETP